MLIPVPVPVPVPVLLRINVTLKPKFDRFIVNCTTRDTDKGPIKSSKWPVDYLLVHRIELLLFTKRVSGSHLVGTTLRPYRTC